MQRVPTRLLCLLATFVLSITAQAQKKLPGSVPPWANAKNYVSAANPGDDVGFRVYLGWNNSAAVGVLAQAVSNPGAATGPFSLRSNSGSNLRLRRLR
jgi:hypothetical protein